MRSPVPFHLPGHRRREEARAIRERAELQIAQAEALELARVQILAERENPRATIRGVVGGAVWRNRGFLAPFALLAALAAAGWWSFWTLLAWLAGAAWWWSRGHLPQDWTEPVEPPEWEPLPEPDDIPHRWAANLAADGRTLAGSEITDTVVLPHADRFTVQLVPGKQTVEGVGDSLGLVASGLRTPLAKIVWEPHPDHEEDDSTVGRLTVVRHNVRDEIRYFRLPEFRDGVVLLGDHIDLDGHAGWEVYAENSIRGGLIAGTTDYGKSRLLDVLAASIMSPEFQARYPTHILYVDGQGGASSPLLWEHATLTAGPDDADEIVRAVLRMGGSRQAWNVTHGVTGFNPGVSPGDGVEGLPGWLVIADESHVIWSDLTRAKPWTRIAREKRKNGLGLISSGHVTDLSGFGEDDALRGSLLRGNGVVFRIESTMAGSRIPGLPTPPHKLPKIRGYFQMVPGENRGRSAPARGWFSPTGREKAKAAAKGAPIPQDVPTLEEHFARAVRPPVGDMDAKALGIVYTHRNERAAAKAERDRAIAEGRELPGEREQVALVRPLPTAAEATAEQVTTTRGAILAHLREHGRAKRADLIAHAANELGTSPDAVTKALTALVGKREIARLEGGFYEIADQPDTAAAN